MSKSHGLIVNSFYELEPSFTDYWNKNFGPKAWCIGPLCLTKPQISRTLQRSTWVQWLDLKLAMQQPVLYVAFGTQADISVDQLSEVAISLEKSMVNFLWAMRREGVEFFEGFEEKVKDRRMIVNDWVDQMEILGHESVQGFLSQCGWNSVLEGICAKVPILALPFMAEQHLNVGIVVEEISIGLRIWPNNGSVRGFVKSEEVEKIVRELMVGERGDQEVRKKVTEVGEAALRAANGSGSSWCTLGLLIEKICGKDVN